MSRPPAVCYRCKEPGHFARDCVTTSSSSGDRVPLPKLVGGTITGECRLTVPKSRKEASQNWKLLSSQIEKPKIFKHRRKLKSEKLPPVPDTTDDPTNPVNVTVVPKHSEVIPGFPVYNSEGKQIGGKEISVGDKKLSWCVAMDCEMVGVGPMCESALARVSIVNESGYCVFDKFVKPKVKVTDYRTEVSGIRKSDLDNADTFDSVVWKVSTILRNRVVVGHSLEHDFKALLLTHPKMKIRDTSLFYKSSRKPALRALARKFLNISIQEGEHNSILDAQAAMKLYLINRKSWEEQIKKYKSARRREIVVVDSTNRTAATLLL